jgi:hypothetical protein
MAEHSPAEAEISAAARGEGASDTYDAAALANVRAYLSLLDSWAKALHELFCQHGGAGVILFVFLCYLAAKVRPRRV